MLTAIPIKTAIPTGTPAAEGAFEAQALASGGNQLEITGRCTVGSGTLYLLRWFPDLELWRVWRSYSSMTVAAATLSGHFSGTFALPTGNTSWLLYDPAATITATAHAALRSY